MLQCSETGQLTSQGLFLSRAAVQWVHRHISASKPCCAAKMGLPQIQVDVLTSDVLAGAGGAAGPAPDVTASDTSQKVPQVQSIMFSEYIPHTHHIQHQGLFTGSLVVQHAACYARGCRFNSQGYALLTFCFFRVCTGT